MVRNFRKLESTFNPTLGSSGGLGWRREAGDQLRDSGSESSGELLHVVDGDVALAALDPANVIAMEAR
jgi:hypothetical protein